MPALPSPEDPSADPSAPVGPVPTSRADLHPLPSAGELDELEIALAQRVRGVEAFLADAYGPRRAVAGGVVSHGLLTTAPGFSREAATAPLPRRWAPLIAVDLVRGPEGRWLVTDSRTGTLRPWARAMSPTGTAAADGWDEHVVGALAACAPPEVGDPLVAVLLPPGAPAPWWSFAQRHGLAAVRPADLRSARGQLLLATTAGLVPVHVLVRPVADDRLDPVSGGDPSVVTTGCPGLLTAVRSGSLALVGALGSALADDVRLRSRFGDLVRFHLGEEPLLGDAPFAAAGDDVVRVLVAAAGGVVRVALAGRAQDDVGPGAAGRTDTAAAAPTGAVSAATGTWDRRIDTSGSRVPGPRTTGPRTAGPRTAGPGISGSGTPVDGGLDLRDPPATPSFRRLRAEALVGEPC